MITIFSFNYNYNNTSFKTYGSPYSSRWPLIRDLIRNCFWPLPYKSTIVVPICPINPEKIEKDLVGYLCVDSPKRRVFKKKHDIDLMCGVADGIFNTIKKIKEKESEYST